MKKIKDLIDIEDFDNNYFKNASMNYYNDEYFVYYYFRELYITLTLYMLTDDNKKDTDEYIREFCIDFLTLLQVKIENHEQKILEIKDYISALKDSFQCIQDINNTKPKVFMKSIKESFNLSIQQSNEIKSILGKYSFEKAFEYLNNNLTDNSIHDFIKVILLSDDELNVEILYKLRSIILNSKYIDNTDKVFFSRKNVENKDLVSLFLSDYTITLNIFKVLFNLKKYKEEGKEKFIAYIYYLTYARFVLYMLLIFLQYKDIMLESKEAIIVINAICNKIDLYLYTFVNKSMAGQEILCLILRKLIAIFCIFELSNSGLCKIKKSIKYKIQTERFLLGRKNDDIIKEMADIALKEWNKLNTISHIAMIEFLRNKDEKYASALKERGVESNLKKKLVRICRENNFPYIQGEDMHKRVKREKPASKKAINQRRKK